MPFRALFSIVLAPATADGIYGASADESGAGSSITNAMHQLGWSNRSIDHLKLILILENAGRDDGSLFDYFQIDLDRCDFTSDDLEGEKSIKEKGLNLVRPLCILAYLTMVPSFGPPAALLSSVSMCIANLYLSLTRMTVSPKTNERPFVSTATLTI